ncbi:MAG TPA: hypothetical protein VH458_02575, partial [Vicinamibacterales bacterium]
RVTTSSLESYETFVSTQLGDVPGVDKLDSHLTMKLIKSPEHQIAPPTPCTAPDANPGLAGYRTPSRACASGGDRS